MLELRFVERDERSLIVTDDNGVQYRVPVDDDMLSELRSLLRAPRSDAPKVNPREIQSRLRAGEAREDVMEATGAELSDIERYEGPILAEFRYIIETARAVPVRTEHTIEDVEQVFGEIIDERLQQLEASATVWSSWRDEESGWMVKLTFESRSIHHEAVWSFDHKKQVLTPITPDAVNLSKQGEVGDRLIPTLRAVDAPAQGDRFDSGVFEALTDDPADLTDDSEEPGEANENATEPTPVKDTQTDSEYERRLEIEQRAIATAETPVENLGETADLLDALRRRRGAREALASERGHEAPATDAEQGTPSDSAPVPSSEPDAPHALRIAQDSPERGAKKGRTTIPSWDEILFGTRSDEDAD